MAVWSTEKLGIKSMGSITFLRVLSTNASYLTPCNDGQSDGDTPHRLMLLPIRRTRLLFGPQCVLGGTGSRSILGEHHDLYGLRALGQTGCTGLLAVVRPATPAERL